MNTRIAASILLALAMVIAVGCCGHKPTAAPAYPTSVVSDTEIARFPAAELWLDKDHTVNRTAILNDPGTSVAWVILHDGKQVLARNAKNETQYRYFRNEPGTYSIYLHQSIDGQYRVISNVVSYRIEP